MVLVAIVYLSFPEKLKIFLFEILLPNSKAITVGTIYNPPSQTNFLEVLNNNINKINPVDNKIYILGNFNINLFLNYS